MICVLINQINSLITPSMLVTQLPMRACRFPPLQLLEMSDHVIRLPSPHPPKCLGRRADRPNDDVMLKRIYA